MKAIFVAVLLIVSRAQVENAEPPPEPVVGILPQTEEPVVLKPEIQEPILDIVPLIEDTNLKISPEPTPMPGEDF